jgi:hypothetical protein
MMGVGIIELVILALVGLFMVVGIAIAITLVVARREK